jgi:prophage tail gpP-like protein
MVAINEQFRSLKLTLVGDESEYQSGGDFTPGDSLEMWMGFTLRESFLDPLGSFSVQVSPIVEKFTEYVEKLSKGSVVRLVVGDNVQATGVITTQTISIGKGGATISLTIKGMLSAAYESSISPTFSVSSKSDVPVSEFIMTVMAPFFDNRELDLNNKTGADLLLKSGRQTGSPLFNLPAPVPVKTLKVNKLKAQKGETVYAFVSRMISRLGFILKTDVYGGLLLDRPIYEQDASYTLVCGSEDTVPQIKDSNLMLEGITITDSNDGQFSEIVVRGQTNTVKIGNPYPARTNPKEGLPPTNANLTPPPVKQASRTNTPIAGVRLEGAIDVYTDDYKNTERWFEIPKGRKAMIFPYKAVSYSELPSSRHHYKSIVQPYKPKFSEDKLSRDTARCRTFAGLMFGVRSPSGYMIRCSVHGFVAATGAMWTPNTVVRVVIDKLGIDENMWIFAREFSANRGQGQVTNLTLMPLGALVLGEIPR